MPRPGAATAAAGPGPAAPGMLSTATVIAAVLALPLVFLLIEAGSSGLHEDAHG